MTSSVPLVAPTTNTSTPSQPPPSLPSSSSSTPEVTPGGGGETTPAVTGASVPDGNGPVLSPTAATATPSAPASAPASSGASAGGKTETWNNYKCAQQLNEFFMKLQEAEAPKEVLEQAESSLDPVFRFLKQTGEDDSNAIKASQTPSIEQQLQEALQEKERQAISLQQSQAEVKDMANRVRTMTDQLPPYLQFNVKASALGEFIKEHNSKDDKENKLMMNTLLESKYVSSMMKGVVDSLKNCSEQLSWVASSSPPMIQVRGSVGADVGPPTFRSLGSSPHPKQHVVWGSTSRKRSLETSTDTPTTSGGFKKPLVTSHPASVFTAPAPTAPEVTNSVLDHHHSWNRMKQLRANANTNTSRPL